MAFPEDPHSVGVGLFIDGVWVDAITDVGVLERDPIQVSYGRSNWSSRTDPSRATFTLDNRDGRWSPDLTTGTHFGDYRRNIPTRIGVGLGDPYLAYTEVSADVISTPDIAGTGGGAPTAPAFVDVTQDAETTSTTSHTYSLSATMAAGDRLLLIVHALHESLTPTDQGGGVTDLDDWTLVVDEQLYSPWDGWKIYERGPLTAAEATALAGSTVEFSTALSVKSSSQVIRTSGARAGGAGVAYDVAYDLTSSFSSTPNPPPVTASWGADEHRWYAIAIYGSGTDTVSAYPASYTSIADGNATTRVNIGTAHRTTSAATEDPGTFTLTGDENWQCVTFVYRAEEDTSADGVLDNSGDLDVRFEIQPHKDLIDTADGGRRFRICQKSSGLDGWGVDLGKVSGDLVMRFLWVDTSSVLHVYDTGTSLPLRAAHDRMAFKIEFDADNGSSDSDATFSYADSMAGPWTLINVDTGEGVTSIKTNDASLKLMGVANDTRDPLPGKMFAFELRDGIDGTETANPDFTAEALGASSFTDDAGRVWTLGTGGEITDMRWRFHGELASLPVRWDIQGRDVWAPVEATGLFRRLRQGERVLESAIRRAILRLTTNVVQYWPMEEQGANVTSFGAAIGSAPFLITGGFPTAATSTEFVASGPLPTPGDTKWTATVDSYSTANEWQLRWLQTIPSDYTGSTIVFLRIETTDMTWEVEYDDQSSGNLLLRAKRGGSEVYTSGAIGFAATGKSFRMQLWVRQNGSNVDIRIVGQQPGEPLGGGLTETNAVAGIAGQVTKITINPDADVDDWAFGHFTLQSVITASSELATELNAHDGEKAGDRIVRLLLEEGIASRVEGDPADTEAMGPQKSGTLMDLLQECADTDLGILHEARNSVAVAYRTRASMVGQDLKTLPDETSLAAWWTAEDLTATTDQTIPNRLEGGTGATLGSTSSSGDAEDPTVTLGTPNRIDPDGTDDYIQAPYTPTFTATTGELTVIFVGYWDAADTTASAARLVSFEGAGADGLYIHSSATSVARPRVQVGGASAAVGVSPPNSPTLADDELFAVAAVVDDGTVAAYMNGEGLSSTESITGVGTITFASGRLFARAYSNISNATSGVVALIVIERALTEAELDDTTDWIINRHQSGKILLDYGAGQVAAPLELDRDDQGFANDVNIENASGATARAVLDDGSVLSVSEPPVGAGRYDTRFEVNGQDTRLTNLAESRLALTAVDEPRVSRLAVALNHAALVAKPSLTRSIMDATLGDLVTVHDNLPIALGATQIRQLLQGTRDTIGNFTHRIDMLTSPASPWETSGGTTGITDPPAAHSVEFRSQNTLATSGQPAHCLTALGYTGTYPVTRAQIDTILDDWVASTGGTTWNVTSSATETTAVSSCEPGDLIRVTAEFDDRVKIAGNRYSMPGSTLTTSPAGGLPGLPIVFTCADGVYVDDNNTSSNNGVFDFQNCEHVWGIGLNARDAQFGVRTQNWGGSAGFPAYIAYCNIENIGDSGLVAQGWVRALADDGGTAPAGAGNEWGFSQYGVFESNTIDGVGVRTGGAPGEGIYAGFGAAPGWKGYVKDFWIRGNVATDWTSDGIDIKPGCHRIYITDNEIHTGHAVSGSPVSLCYVSSSPDFRPTEFRFDPEIYFEGNRVYDSDITNVDAGSVHIMGYLGLSGMRIANNVYWAWNTSGQHAMWRIRNEQGTNDTEALTIFRADPTWIINNTCWNDDIVDEAGYGAGPTAWPSSVSSSWDFRNNIREDSGSGTTHGDVEATSADFIATVPAIGVAGDAEWETYGNGSAFDLAITSSLIGTGESITDIEFLIDEDISQRAITKATPNPGAFQPHPANE